MSLRRTVPEAHCFILSVLNDDLAGRELRSCARGRFGISVDGVQIDGTKKPKAKGLKSSSGKKGGSGQNAKPVSTSPKKKTR